MNQKTLNETILELLKERGCCRYDDYIPVLSVNTDRQNIKHLLHKILLTEKKKLYLIYLLSGTFTDVEWKLICESSGSIWGSKKYQLTQIWNSIDQKYPRLEKKHGINRESFRSKIMNLSRIKWNALKWLFNYYIMNVSANNSELWFANLNSLSSTRINKIKKLNELSEKNDLIVGENE